MAKICRTSSGMRALRFRDTLVRVRMSADDGSDGLSVLEHRAAKGEAPPLHVHRNEDEVFHVISGKLLFEIDGERMTVSDGDVVLAPRGVPHRFLVQSDAGAHWLTIMRGRDFESLVRDVSMPTDMSDPPAISHPGPEEIAALTAACSANGIDIVGPPMH
ncbi:MAG: cupin domain-containing protein [Alphaproteobacteria bacterium]|nr:cupin domain-containing protein [Alphaproteobacteria bacterium]